MPAGREGSLSRPRKIRSVSDYIFQEREGMAATILKILPFTVSRWANLFYFIRFTNLVGQRFVPLINI